MIQTVMKFTVILFGFLFVTISMGISKEMELCEAQPGELTFPKAVFLDWDNTLVNSWPILLKIMNNAITPYGKQPLKMEDFRSLPNINMPQGEIIRGLFGEDRPDVVDSYWDNYHQEHLKVPFELDTGVIPLLTYLNSCKIFTSIVSNQEHPILLGNVEKADLTKYVHNTIGSIRGSPEKNKPMIGVIQRALEGSPFAEEEIGKAHGDWWFVGDGDTDIHTALNSNCFPVWVSNYAIRPIPFSNNLHAPRGIKVDSLDHLLDLLKSLKLSENSKEGK